MDIKKNIIKGKWVEEYKELFYLYKKLDEPINPE